MADTGGVQPEPALKPTAKQMWERACPRMQWIIHQMHGLTPRIREQARSHMELRMPGLVHRQNRATQLLQ